MATTDADSVRRKNDYIFPVEGAYPYKRSLKNMEFYLLDNGHFAFEEDCDVIAGYTHDGSYQATVLWK